ncbi:MAG: ABC transporter ATP-binding protein [Planctomycetota bacterium]
MIRVEGLRAGYPTGFRRTWVEVLQGVSFHVPRGSITGYLGVNGAGKTTTIKVLVGINAPTGGAVTIGGHPVGSGGAQRQLGYFPEAPFFYEGLSARELLEFFARLADVPRGERGVRADALLEEVGLGEARDLPVRGYSKGMRQRLGLAQALVHEPELLVLDEPLDGLDPMGRLHLRQAIARQREAGRTVFFSSHVLSDVEAVSDHLVVLDGGKVAYDGSVSGIGVEGEQAAVDVWLVAPAERTPDLEAAAGAALRDAGPAEGEGPAEGAGGRARRFEALCPDAAAADRLARAVYEGGGRLLSLTPRRGSLEDVFLRRFGQGAAPASPAPPSPPPTSPASVPGEDNA